LAFEVRLLPLLLPGFYEPAGKLAARSTASLFDFPRSLELRMFSDFVVALFLFFAAFAQAPIHFRGILQL